jgi:hypothetical protein
MVSSMPAFVVCYVAGAALLALWVDVRFPGLRPTGWLRLGVAIGAVMLADELCTRFLHTDPAIVGVMGVGFPVIAVTMLVCLWALRAIRAAMPT